MSAISIVLAVLALLPAIALMIYIYKMDRYEKEPIGLLIGLFFMGVLSTVPTIILELLFGKGLNLMFLGPYGDDPSYLPAVSYYLYQILENFICVALIEEFFKWLFVFLVTHKNKNFNSLFDGVVYSVFVSLGFAAAENLIYVFQNGLGNALMRMVTAVPAHCFFAVLMGYYYSMWHLNSKAASLEKHLLGAGVVPAGQPGFKSGGMLALSIFVPTLAHGFYDFCATVDSWIFLIIFFLFLGFLYFFCFRKVIKLSKADTQSNFLSMDLVLKKYPNAVSYVSTLPEFAQYFIAYNAQMNPQPVQNQAPQGGYNYAQPVQNQSPQGGYNYAQPVQNQPQGGYNYAQPVQNQPQSGYNYDQPVQNQPQGGYNYAQPVQNQAPQGGYNYAQPVQNQPQSGYNYVQPVQNQPQGGYNYAQPVQNQPQGGYNYAQPVQNQPQGGYNFAQQEQNNGQYNNADNR